MKSFWLASTALFQTAMSYSRSSGMGEELIDGFNIQVSFNAWSQIVSFRVVIPNNTWLGLILGSQDHTNSDMI